MATDLKALGRNDRGAVVTGALAVLFTFFGSYLTISTEPPLPRTVDPNGFSAWDGIGALGSLLIVLALAFLAVRIFASDMLPAQIPWHLVTAGAAGVGTLILITKGLTFGVDGPKAVQEHVNAGIGWSGWVLFLLGIAFTVFLALGTGSAPAGHDAPVTED